MRVTKVTPILIVEAIEPVLATWERLGFEKRASVPETGELVFALLGAGEHEVMLQTARSLTPAVRGARSLVYMDVDSLDAAARAVAGLVVLEEPHATFYGTRELSVRDASGQVLVFAEHVGGAT